MSLDYRPLLEREVHRMDAISEERPLTTDETKRLSLFLKHLENLTEGKELDLPDVALSPEQLIKELGLLQ